VVEQVGIRPARFDHGHLHPTSGQLHSQCVGQRFHGKLGAVVNAQVGEGLEPRQARGVDQKAASLWFHVPQRHIAHTHHRLEVEPDHGAKRLEVGRFNAANVHHPGVVENGVEPSEFFHGRVNEHLRQGRVDHVAGDHLRTGQTVLPGDQASLYSRAVNRQIIPASGKLFSGGFSDAAVGPCYEYDFSF
jgi:hypothetical protein